MTKMVAETRNLTLTARLLSLTMILILNPSQKNNEGDSHRYDVTL